MHGQEDKVFFFSGNRSAPGLDTDLRALEGIAAGLVPELLHERSGAARIGLELERRWFAVPEGDGRRGLLVLWGLEAERRQGGRAGKGRIGAE